MEVKVINNQIESAMQKLKRQLIREGLFKDLKKRRYYAKPSVKAKLKREEAEKAKHKDRKRAVARGKNIL
ncbi:MAG: 30S ribosomal protein S21 [bacterium]|nr:30S ribosomal protein S21 [bacterium]